MTLVIFCAYSNQATLNYVTYITLTWLIIQRDLSHPYKVHIEHNKLAPRFMSRFLCCDNNVHDSVNSNTNFQTLSPSYYSSWWSELIFKMYHIQILTHRWRFRVENISSSVVSDYNHCTYNHVLLLLLLLLSFFLFFLLLLMYLLYVYKNIYLTATHTHT
jgi:hypothetical protein